MTGETVLENPSINYSNMCQACLTSFTTINDFFANIAMALRNPAITKFVIILTDIGRPRNILMFCIVVAMVLWLHKKIDHLIQFVITVSTGALVVTLTKMIIHLPRPIGGLIEESGYSFASGHATMAMIFFMLIAYSYKSHIENLIMKRLFVALNILIAVFIGATRIYLGVHYATDVIGGLLIGLIISGASIIMFEKHQRSKLSEKVIR